MRADAEVALDLLAPGSQFRPTATYLLGSAELYQGNVDAADQHLADAVELGPKLGASAAVTTASATRAIIAIGRGRWQDAKAFLEKSTSVIHAAHLRSYSTTALTYAAQARVAMHDGDPRAARETPQAAEQLLPLLTRALAHLAIQTRLELIRTYVALGDIRRRDRSTRGGRRAVTEHTRVRLVASRGRGTVSDGRPNTVRRGRRPRAHRRGAPASAAPCHPAVIPRDR